MWTHASGVCIFYFFSDSSSLKYGPMVWFDVYVNNSFSFCKNTQHRSEVGSPRGLVISAYFSCFLQTVLHHEVLL